jgi:hypothetical protein
MAHILVQRARHMPELRRPPHVQIDACADIALQGGGA